MAKNPFIEDAPVIHLRDISKNFLIQAYRKAFQIDITPIVGTTGRISLYKCSESGYCFFHPFKLAGDSGFYEKLQENDWYYMPWKWEHEVCKKFIREKDRVLEVGCGRGDFLKTISSQFKDVQCVGLELNKSAVFSDGNCTIHNIPVEDFSQAHAKFFDLVCSFQVLEHVPYVNRFLEASIRCLKTDGLLIVCVPNNNSFIKYDRTNILNMPPHHMGLWSEESLRKIGQIFHLNLVEVCYEPLQPQHFSYYLSVMLGRFAGRLPFRIIWKAIRLLNAENTVNSQLAKWAHKIKGHSILIAFRKTADR